jgi:GT2 family glycosyltransferase
MGCEDRETRPELSVVIASYNSANTIAGCLTSLEKQKSRRRVEVIVVDSSSDGTADLIAEQFPWVRLCHSPRRRFCGTARNAGVASARADIIAFIDADCVAADNWVDEILDAHELPDPAVGGTIANGNPESRVGWAAYFCEFSAWMPGTPASRLVDVAGANMSYKRSLFAELGPLIDGTYCSDTEFHWRLSRTGRSIRFVPDILISHRNIADLWRFVRHEYEHGRSFARVRVASHGFSPLRRAIYAVLFPLLAGRRFLAIAWSNGRNRVYLSPFLETLPLVAAGLLAWAWGEGVGYVTARR